MPATYTAAMKTSYPLYYGLTSALDAYHIAKRVCDALGHGKYRNAVNMLLETACVETDLGRFKDPTPNGAGAGLTQGDPIAIKDVVARTRTFDKWRIMMAFNINLNTLTSDDLKESPLHAFIFTRCFYKLIPEHFPRTLELRADYWKTHYNTEKGSGTREKYEEKSIRYLYGADTELKNLFNKRNSI